MNILFENITVVSPSDNLHERRYVWLKDNRIVWCRPEQPEVYPETECLNGTEWVLAPGFFDMHVYLREPEYTMTDTIRIITNTAANGGFTGICIMPDTDSMVIDSSSTVEYITNRTKGKLTDVVCSAAITKGDNGTQLTSMRKLHDAGVAMFSNTDNAIPDAETVRNAFDYVGAFDGVLSENSPEHSMTKGFVMNEGRASAEFGMKGYPSVAEEIIINRDILLASYCHNSRYHVSHISTKGGVEMVRDAKKRGQKVTCEVAPHHFVLTDNDVRRLGGYAKVNPPLRSADDIQTIKEGVKEGWIDVIASSHKSCSRNEKEIEVSIALPGITGLESSLGLATTYLLHEGYCNLERLVSMMSVNPRTILKLPEITVQEGVQPNLTIFAPEEKWTFSQECSQTPSRNTPFAGFELQGKPKFAINNGQVFSCAM
jgi:dihydroorotase